MSSPCNSKLLGPLCNLHDHAGRLKDPLEANGQSGASGKMGSHTKQLREMTFATGGTINAQVSRAKKRLRARRLGRT